MLSLLSDILSARIYSDILLWQSMASILTFYLAVSGILADIVFLAFCLTFFLAYTLTFLVAFYLAYTLTFFLTFYLASILTFSLASILTFFLVF